MGAALQPILAEHLHKELAAYAAQYDAIRADYMRDVAALGLPFAAEEDGALAGFLAKLPPGVRADNDGKSLFYGRRSPACEACRKGEGSVTLYLSLRCHHRCFYCFNPNQEHYERYRREAVDAAGELAAMHGQGRRLSHIALSRGEHGVLSSGALALSAGALAALHGGRFAGCPARGRPCGSGA